RRRHTRFSRDWSSDVCSSDLEVEPDRGPPAGAERPPRDRAGAVAVAGAVALPVLVEDLHRAGVDAEVDAAEADDGVGGERRVERSEERRVSYVDRFLYCLCRI